MLVSILVPNYKTLTLTKLCLRLLRKYTDPSKAKVIVIDNDSKDDSLDYLRTLSWIELIERKAIPGELPVQSHARALDLGLERVTTPYVLSIHTDTLVKHPNWLEYLIGQMEKHPNIAGVGSWKLELKSKWRDILKFIERYSQIIYYKIMQNTKHQLEGIDHNYFYLRSHCALYKTELLKRYGLCFAADDIFKEGNLHVGKTMHQQLVNHGHQMIFLPSAQLVNYIEHINHATIVLNPELTARQKTIDKGLERIEKCLARLNAQSILADASLDG